MPDKIITIKMPEAEYERLAIAVGNDCAYRRAATDAEVHRWFCSRGSAVVREHETQPPAPPQPLETVPYEEA
jgi:hypothetical protein